MKYKTNKKLFSDVLGIDSKKGKDLKNQSIKSMKGGPKKSSKGCAGFDFFLVESKRTHDNKKPSVAGHQL